MEVVDDGEDEENVDVDVDVDVDGADEDDDNGIEAVLDGLLAGVEVDDVIAVVVVFESAFGGFGLFFHVYFLLTCGVVALDAGIVDPFSTFGESRVEPFCMEFAIERI